MGKRRCSALLLNHLLRAGVFGEPPHHHHHLCNVEEGVDIYTSLDEVVIWEVDRQMALVRSEMVYLRPPHGISAAL